MERSEFMNIESIAPVIRKASIWVIVWSIVTLVCGILAMILPLDVLFWNRADHWLPYFDRRDRALCFCVSDTQR